MNKCKRCLAVNVDDAVFCENCGAKLSANEEAQDEPMQTEEAVKSDTDECANAQGQAEEIFVEAEPVVEEKTEPKGDLGYQQLGHPQPEPQPQPQSEPQQPNGAAAPSGQYVADGIPNPGTKQSAGGQKGESCEGILSMAWHDVRTSEGWFGKSALLALIGLVPILNFVVSGYCMRWGRLASFKNAASKPMPPVAINGDYFRMGFFCVVICMCWSTVISLVCAIPYVGILGTVAGVFAAPMMFMCVQRTNLLNSLGSAFELKNIWEKYRRNLGGALALAWLPSLLVAAVVMAIVLAIILVFGVSSMGLIAGGYFLKALGLIGMLCVIVACYIVLMAGVVANLVIARAFGYWTQRIAPEWIDETYIAAGMTPPSRSA